LIEEFDVFLRGGRTLIEKFHVVLRGGRRPLIERLDVPVCIALFHRGRCFVQRLDIAVRILANLLDGRFNFLLSPRHNRTELILVRSHGTDWRE
jgi:hypothetical protein